jgi:hypothetical protein
MLDFVSTRRDVLKTGGALFVTVTLAEKVLPALAESSAGKKTVAPDEVDGFLSIDADGQVTVYSGKVDLGTGLRTILVNDVGLTVNPYQCARPTKPLGSSLTGIFILIPSCHTTAVRPLTIGGLPQNISKYSRCSHSVASA